VHTLAREGWRARLWGLPLLLVVVLWAQPVASRVWRVEKDGSGDYAVIQDAVDASASGDTIMVGPGRYSEYTDHTYAGNLWHTYVHMVSGSLTLVGAGEGVTVIGPESPGAWASWEYAVLHRKLHTGHTMRETIDHIDELHLRSQTDNHEVPQRRSRWRRVLQAPTADSRRRPGRGADARRDRLRQRDRPAAGAAG